MDEEIIKCKLNGELEKSLSLLNRIKDEKLEVYRELLDNKNKYYQGLKTREQVLESSKLLFENMQLLDIEQDVAEKKRSDAIYKRIANRKNNINKYSKRKVNGVDMQTFRELSLQLYSKLLPNYCSRCHSTERLHIHHLRYRYPPELKDMVRLCAKCHTTHHAQLRKNKKNKLSSRVAMTPPLIADGNLK